jgi:NAD(P)-dependent dehydrogenase (short-subunit alcohol dehydrogenase family)
VNTRGPAFINTPNDRHFDDQTREQNGTSFDEAIESFLEKQRAYLKRKRRREPNEVASVIVFPVSARTSFVNGSNYRVGSGPVATI